MGRLSARGAGGLLLAVVVALAGAAPLRVQAADDGAEGAPGHGLFGDALAPDISGLWLGTSTTAPGMQDPQQPAEGVWITHWAPWPPPLTPDYQKQLDMKVAAAKAGRVLDDPGPRCLPYGMPVKMLIGAFPHEIIQTPGQVSIWEFGLSPIVIFTDGRIHPADLEPTPDGHSIGFWQGDTLHIDTVGIMARTPIDAAPRTPHSAKLHMQWTLQRVAGDIVHLHITLSDADAYTEPMTTLSIWRRKSGPLWQLLDDGSCWENNRNVPDKTGATGFTKF